MAVWQICDHPQAKFTETLDFLTKVRKLGDQPYNAAVEFSAAKSR